MAAAVRLGLCNGKNVKYLSTLFVNNLSKQRFSKKYNGPQFGIRLFHSYRGCKSSVYPATFSKRWYSAQQESLKTETHEVDRNTEKIEGNTEKHEFQAETKMLLDIVAKSLYSDKEVFIRELISNASDALEKLRYVSLTEAKSDQIGSLEIRIATDKQSRTITIQDTGIGMTNEELIANLGTIARSGSKAFLEELKMKGGEASAQQSTVIGQFGVGFYSVFMVADKVEVFTKSHKPGSQGYHWISDGSGTYEINKASNVSAGTKIVIYLKTEHREFSDDKIVQEIIKKYSNFVGSPIFLNVVL